MSKFGKVAVAAASTIFVAAQLFFTPAGRRLLEQVGLYTECAADVSLGRKSCTAKQQVQGSALARTRPFVTAHLEPVINATSNTAAEIQAANASRLDVDTAHRLFDCSAKALRTKRHPRWGDHLRGCRCCEKGGASPLFGHQTLSVCTGKCCYSVKAISSAWPCRYFRAADAGPRASGFLPGEMAPCRMQHWGIYRQDAPDPRAECGAPRANPGTLKLLGGFHPPQRSGNPNPF